MQTHRSYRPRCNRSVAILSFLTLSLLRLAAPAPALGEEALRVFATTPDLADIVREVGGDRVRATSMVKGRRAGLRGCIERDRAAGPSFRHRGPLDG